MQRLSTAIDINSLFRTKVPPGIVETVKELTGTDLGPPITFIPSALDRPSEFIATVRECRTFLPAIVA